MGKEFTKIHTAFTGQLFRSLNIPQFCDVLFDALTDGCSYSSNVCRKKFSVT